MRCSVSLLMILFFCQHSYSQCKTYKLDANHGTINCTDVQNHKQGKWVVRVVDNHGEPGYQENGAYKDDKKQGQWITYNLMGDVIAEENYKWGNKDGICRYYNLLGLMREESWKAIDPANPYDTIRVYHLDGSDQYDLKIVKVEASSVKHGIWTYYDPERQTITRTEEYVIDQLVPATTGKKNTVITDSTAHQKTDSTSIANKNKPAEVLEYEKKNSNKKKIKVRDGATGVN